MARFFKARNPELLQDRKTLKQDTLLLQTESKKIWGHLTGKGRRSGYTTENMGLNQIVERCSITGVGVNVSRALGDVYYGEVMSHKSKITVTQVQPGDIIILACDGLKDYVLEDHIIELVLKNKEANKLASALVQCALDEYHSTDNIMVLVVNIN